MASHKLTVDIFLRVVCGMYHSMANTMAATGSSTDGCIILEILV